MSRADLEGLLKITDRSTQILVIWKKAFARFNGKNHDGLIIKIDTAIAALAEYRFEIKNRLKGNAGLSLEAKLKFLEEEIAAAGESNPDKAYICKLQEMTWEILTAGLLEAKE